MVTIHAEGLDHKALNDTIREISEPCTVDGCCGQRFIAAGMTDKTLDIYGVPGNALGAYLNGGTVTVQANAQDAVGDTMNAGKIVIHGNIGDAAGYAMRGGEIFVKGNAGYRAGIHMKAYKEKIPVMVIGGRTGSFLGEYQAGKPEGEDRRELSRHRDARRQDVSSLPMRGCGVSPTGDGKTGRAGGTAGD